eukprot:COSAG05_NODE_4771_length_1379_cov_1.183594_2_plen_59_part_01
MVWPCVLVITPYMIECNDRCTTYMYTTQGQLVVKPKKEQKGKLRAAGAAAGLLAWHANN